jgi:hypothetical protein
MDSAFSPFAIDPAAFVSPGFQAAGLLITGISLLAALATAFLMGQLVERMRTAHPLRSTAQRSFSGGESCRSQ